MNYITQETAMLIANKFALPQGLGKPHWPVIFNEVIQHYLEAQPAKPVEPSGYAYIKNGTLQSGITSRPMQGAAPLYTPEQSK